MGCNAARSKWQDMHTAQKHTATTIFCRCCYVCGAEILGGPPIVGPPLPKYWGAAPPASLGLTPMILCIIIFNKSKACVSPVNNKLHRSTERDGRLRLAHYFALFWSLGLRLAIYLLSVQNLMSYACFPTEMSYMWRNFASVSFSYRDRHFRLFGGLGGLG